MKVKRAYKVELDLNNRQRTACFKHAGTARFAYNWGLRRKIEAYQQTGRSPSAVDLHRQLNALKKDELSWMYDVSKCAPQEALRDLDQAFENFFRRLKTGAKPGFPRFKSRRRGVGSFRLTGTIQVFDRCIQLPRLGRLRLKEADYLPAESESVHTLSATISECAGRWYVSLQVEEEMAEPEAAAGKPVGVDLGIRTLATCSDGVSYANPKALYRAERQLKRLQRRVARRQPGSQNRKKAVGQLRRQHERVANIRRDTLHKATSSIVAKTKPAAERPHAVVLEDLNVKGMLHNHRLARAISDVGLAEFRRQMAYKAEWYGLQVLVVDRFYPSSKMCSACGTLKSDLSLSNRIYACDACGTRLDRDLNAALNLAALAPTASSAGRMIAHPLDVPVS